MWLPPTPHYHKLWMNILKHPPLLSDGRLPKGTWYTQDSGAGVPGHNRYLSTLGEYCQTLQNGCLDLVGWQEFLRYTSDCSSLSALPLQISSSDVFSSVHGVVCLFVCFLIVLSMPFVSTNWCLSTPPHPIPTLPLSHPRGNYLNYYTYWDVLYLLCAYLPHLPLNRASWERNRVMFIKYHQ